MLDNAVILRARGAKGNLFVSSSGLEPVKVSQCVQELVERLNAYAQAKDKDDVDGYGSQQPHLFDGSMILDMGRYVMYFRLLGQVWMLVLAPNNGRVYSYQLLRNTITQLVSHLCKSQDINVDKIKKNYLQIYYGILACQRVGTQGLQVVLEEMDQQLNLVDPKIASGKKPSHAQSDGNLQYLSATSVSSSSLWTAALRKVTFTLPLQDDTYRQQSSAKSMSAPVSELDDPFLNMELEQKSSLRHRPPPITPSNAEDPFAPPTQIPVQPKPASLLRLSGEPTQQTQVVRDPFAIPKSPLDQNGDPFAASTKIQPVQIVSTDPFAVVSSTTNVKQEAQDPFATISAPSTTGTVKSEPQDPFANTSGNTTLQQAQDPIAAPTALAQSTTSEFDPFAAFAAGKNTQQPENDNKQHKAEELQFEVSETWKGEVRGANVTKAALLGFITIHVQTDVAKTLPSQSLKLVIPDTVQIKNMALNPEVGKKTGDKIMSLNQEYSLSSAKPASLFRYAVLLTSTIEAPVLLRLVTKDLCSENQVMIGIQYTCNPKHSHTSFKMNANLKVGDFFSKPPLRVAPQATFDARAGVLKWQQDSFSSQGILKASFSLEAGNNVEQITKELSATITLEGESKTSFSGVGLTKDDNQQITALKIKNKFEMEIFVN